MNNLSEPRIRDLYPRARRRTSPTLTYETFPINGMARMRAFYVVAPHQLQEFYLLIYYH